MSKTETDIRLPEGFSSWTQLAAMTLNQDYYNSLIKNEPVKPVFFKEENTRKFTQSTKDTETGSEVEYFETDVLTLKIRAFDELNEVLPDLEGLIAMREDLSRRFIFETDVTEAPIVKMIDKLISMKM